MDCPHTIADEWKFFSRRVLTDCSPVQYSEMQKAFYAGFLSCLLTTRDAASVLKEEDGVKYFKNLHAECTQFFETITKG